METSKPQPTLRRTNVEGGRTIYQVPTALIRKSPPRLVPTLRSSLSRHGLSTAALILNAHYNKYTEQIWGHVKPLHPDALGLQGKELTIANVWKPLNSRDFVRVPGSSTCLSKRSVYTDAPRIQLQLNTLQGPASQRAWSRRRLSPRNVHRPLYRLLVRRRRDVRRQVQ